MGHSAVQSLHVLVMVLAMAPHKVGARILERATSAARRRLDLNLVGHLDGSAAVR
jgi:hypothetical protein